MGRDVGADNGLPKATLNLLVNTPGFGWPVAELEFWLAVWTFAVWRPVKLNGALLTWVDG